MKIRVQCFLVGLVALGIVATAAPAGASAAHFYIKHELSEEFKPITESVEAHFESNGGLEWHFPLRETTVLCHAEGTEELFTNGKDELRHFRVSTCVSGACLVEASALEGPYKTALGESGSPVVYSDDIEAGPEVTFKLSGAGCAHPGTFNFKPLSQCRNTVDNTIDLELVFPVVEPEATEQGCHGSMPVLQTMTGRVRLVPLVGRQLEVGP
jgi:hypothetical protein